VADATARKQRLSRAADFERVYRQGRSSQHRLLILYRFERPEEIRGDEDDIRVGITVSRKLGNAVERNKLKRQLKDALGKAQLPAGHDIVAIARPGLPEAIEKSGFEWLQGLVDDLASRLAPSSKS
jgi:ribonuclease P protein component